MISSVASDDRIFFRLRKHKTTISLYDTHFELKLYNKRMLYNTMPSLLIPRYFFLTRFRYTAHPHRRQMYHVGQRTAPFYFGNSFVRTVSVNAILGTGILQYYFDDAYIPYSAHNQTLGISLSFKVQRASTPCPQSHRAVFSRDTRLRL